MKLIRTEIEETEYQYEGNIITEICTKKYLLGILIEKTVDMRTREIPPITEIKRNTYRFGEVTLKKGMKVLNRSNEPDDLMVGEIIGFETCNYKYLGDKAIPIVQDIKNGGKYLSMSILVPYSDELYEKLQKMKPIEQYNYLTFPFGQIKEKYGIKYRTFK